MALCNIVSIGSIVTYVIPFDLSSTDTTKHHVVYFSDCKLGEISL